MYCKYLSKSLNGKIKCTKLKRYIVYPLSCENCLERNVVTNKPIKKKSNKLIKLEKERDKGINKLGKCEYCGKYAKLDSHEVYGGSNRQRSIKYGFVKRLCRECHSSEKIIADLRIKVQKEYEKQHTREEFIKIIGKSYIKEELKWI